MMKKLSLLLVCSAMAVVFAAFTTTPQRSEVWYEHQTEGWKQSILASPCGGTSTQCSVAIPEEENEVYPIYQTMGTGAPYLQN